MGIGASTPAQQQWLEHVVQHAREKQQNCVDDSRKCSWLPLIHMYNGRKVMSNAEFGYPEDKQTIASSPAKGIAKSIMTKPVTMA
jgi:hypothetical protein